MNDRPSMKEISMLQAILHKAKYRNVADAFLKGFLWAVWPEWYDEYAEALKTPGGYVKVGRER